MGDGNREGRAGDQQAMPHRRLALPALLGVLLAPLPAQANYAQGSSVFTHAPTLSAQRFPRPRQVELSGPEPDTPRVAEVAEGGSLVLAGPFPAGA